MSDKWFVITNNNEADTPILLFTSEGMAKDYCKNDAVSKHTIYEGISAERRERERYRWKPIDSAPKDGRPIWVSAEGSIRIAFWQEGKEHENHGSVGGGWRDQARAEHRGLGALTDLDFLPTHWMPLPAAPDREST